jgi:50S ribosomal protein L16 3-hydroxylase
LRDLMLAHLDNDTDLHNYLAAFMSRFRLAHEPAPTPDTVSQKDVLAAMKGGAKLMRNPWTRLAWVENPAGARLYAAGQPYDCSSWFAQALCAPGQPGISADTLDQASLATLTKLIANGHFQLL